MNESIRTMGFLTLIRLVCASVIGALCLEPSALAAGDMAKGDPLAGQLTRESIEWFYRGSLSLVRQRCPDRVRWLAREFKQKAEAVRADSVSSAERALAELAGAYAMFMESRRNAEAACAILTELERTQATTALLPDVLFYHGVILSEYEAGKAREAAFDKWRAVVKRFPESRAAALAQLQLFHWRPTHEIPWHESDYALALEEADKAIKADKEGWVGIEARHRKAIYLRRQGRVDESAKCLEEVLALYEKNPGALTEEEWCYVLREVGYRYRELEKYDEMEKALAKAAALAPATMVNLEARSGLANVRFCDLNTYEPGVRNADEAAIKVYRDTMAEAPGTLQEVRAIALLVALTDLTNKREEALKLNERLLEFPEREALGHYLRNADTYSSANWGIFLWRQQRTYDVLNELLKVGPRWSSSRKDSLRRSIAYTYAVDSVFDEVAVLRAHFASQGDTANVAKADLLRAYVAIEKRRPWEAEAVTEALLEQGVDASIRRDIELLALFSRYERGNEAAVAPELERLIAESTDDFELAVSHLLLGAYWYRERELDKAAPHFRKARSLAEHKDITSIADRYLEVIGRVERSGRLGEL